MGGTWVKIKSSIYVTMRVVGPSPNIHYAGTVNVSKASKGKSRWNAKTNAISLEGGQLGVRVRTRT